MGNEHNGRAIRVYLAQLFHYLVGALAVERACRLIGKNHLWLVDHTATDTRPLQLTARYLVDVVVGDFNDAETAHQLLAAFKLFLCGKRVCL